MVARLLQQLHQFYLCRSLLISILRRGRLLALVQADGHIEEDRGVFCLERRGPLRQARGGPTLE